MISINSANFGFLKADNPQLVRLGALAEHYFQDDPNTCLIKLRQFGELPAQTTAAHAGLFTSPDEPQADLIRKLKLDRILPGETADLFHQVRIAGNRATHHLGGTHAAVLASLKIAANLLSGFIALPRRTRSSHPIRSCPLPIRPRPARPSTRSWRVFARY